MSPDKIPPQEAHINIGSTKDLETISELYLTNLPQDVITTTEDKLHLCLEQHLKKMEKKKSWITPLGLLISFALTLISANFKDTAFVDAATLKAIFIIAEIIFFGWLVYSVIESLRSEKIEDVIGELKKHSESMIRSVKK